MAITESLWFQELPGLAQQQIELQKKMMRALNPHMQQWSTQRSRQKESVEKKPFDS
jgi:hypothetical protein